MFIHLPACLLTCLPAHLPACPPACLPTCLPAHLPTCLSTQPPAEWRCVGNQPASPSGCLQNVDLFSKDYVFVPIHEALHWSLALICHPGRWAQQLGQPGTCILHLDSMASGQQPPPPQPADPLAEVGCPMLPPGCHLLPAAPCISMCMACSMACWAARLLLAWLLPLPAGSPLDHCCHLYILPLAAAPSM
ncbi:hypothetical protein V8C86DRAFT_1825015 [Haematococcus lacustris]